MRNRHPLLLYSVLLWHGLSVRSSEEQNRQPWPRRDDVNEWPVNLQQGRVVNHRRWPSKESVDSDNPLSWMHSPTSQSHELVSMPKDDSSDRSMYEPFDSSAEVIMLEQVEVKEKIRSLVQSPQAVSHVPSHVSSIDSFFQGDFENFISCNDPLWELEEEEVKQRLIIVGMSDSFSEVMTEWFNQRECIEQEYVDDVQYLYWYDALCDILLSDKRTFTVMHVRKGSFKWRGIHSDLEKICAELLNYCDNRRHLLWQECTRACSIYVNHAMQVARMLHHEN